MLIIALTTLKNLSPDVLTPHGCSGRCPAAGCGTRFRPTPVMLDAAVAAHGPLHGLVVAGPASPTGTVLGPGDLAGPARWCAQHGTRLFSDEVHHGIVHTAPDATGPPADGAFHLCTDLGEQFERRGSSLEWCRRLLEV